MWHLKIPHNFNGQMKKTEELLVNVCDLKLYSIFYKMMITTKAGGPRNKNQ